MNSAVKYAKTVIYLVSIVLIAFMAYAFVYGDISQSGPILFGSPWGLMTIVDLYAGFILFAIFIVSQEQQLTRYAPWVIALMFLGNLVACLYLLMWLNRKKHREGAEDNLAALKTNIRIK